MLRRYLSAVARLAATAALVTAVVVLVLLHGSAGIKGSFVPLTNVGACVMLSAAATFLCQALWSRIPAPFVGGIAGVFAGADHIAGPYYGSLGLLIGLLVVLWVPSRRRISHRLDHGAPHATSGAPESTCSSRLGP